jgi:hypothetical protein
MDSNITNELIAHKYSTGFNNLIFYFMISKYIKQFKH